MRNFHLSKSKLLQKINENKIIVFLFIIATAFFIYQHAMSLSWDFGTYVLNAKYWFADGKYFEILRPPLMPLLLGVFSFLGWKASEYIFILFVSALFAYSSTRLAKSINFHPAAFYALSLNIYLLNYGLINGTELLSLVFLELFIAFLIENKYSSGLFLGLSALSRYTSLAFAPLILLHLKFKNILKSLILFGAVLSLWFTYNFYKFGNFFTSIVDQYANNILYRDYIIKPVQLSHFIEAQNILIPFFILGFVIILIKIFKTAKSVKLRKIKSFFDVLDKLKIEIIMIFLLFYSVSSYTHIPIKGARYLFNLVLPTIYFSYIGINYLVMNLLNLKKEKTKAKKDKIKKINCLLIIIAAVLVLVNFSIALNSSCRDYDPSDKYISAIDKLNELNLSNCSMESNSWIKLDYYGMSASPSPRITLINNSIEKGNVIVLFKQGGEPDAYSDSINISSLLVYDDSSYLIIGSENCRPIKEFKESYIQQTDSAIFEMYNYHINTNPCFTMFRNSSLLEKTCNFVNLNGFKQDDNRRLE